MPAVQDNAASHLTLESLGWWVGQTTWPPSLSHLGRNVAQPGVLLSPCGVLGMSPSLALMRR